MKSFKDLTSEFFADWKAEYERMELQVSLGKMEAKDKFEEQKTQFLAYLQNLKANLPTGDSEKNAKLKAKIEELEIQVALGKMEAKDKYEEYKAKTEQLLRETATYLNESKATGTEHFEKHAIDFKQKLDIFKLHFKLGSMEFKEEWEEEKKEIKEKLDELKKDMEKAKEIAEKKFDESKTFVSKHLSHLGESIKDWWD